MEIGIKVVNATAKAYLIAPLKEELFFVTRTLRLTWGLLLEPTTVNWSI